MDDPLELACLDTFRSVSPTGFAIVVNLGAKEFDWVHMEYPEPWVEHYVENDFINIDPTITFAQSEIGHISWSKLAADYPNNQVMTESPKFGLGEGNTLSVSINGRRSLASGAGPVWPKSLLPRLVLALGTLHRLHARYEAAKLNPKMIEVITLLANGFRDQEIAAKLGVKIETVRTRRNSAYAKTGTKTPAHLVATCLREGLI